MYSLFLCKIMLLACSGLSKSVENLFKMKFTTFGFRTSLFVFIVLFFMGLNRVYAQSATAAVQGKIVDSENQPLSGVNIYLQKTKIGTTSDKHGHYVIQRIPPGVYSLQASSVGYKPFIEEINLEEGDVLHLNLKIKKSVSLKLVEIVANGNPITDKRSTYVARMPLSPMDNPQSYDIVPKELMKQQMNITLGDALTNAAGTSVVQTGTKGKEGMSLRGFGIKTRTKDGMANFSKTAIDPANIERIEIIRGPSATLFGAELTSFGGLVNIITKKPYKTFGVRLDYTYRNIDNLHRTTVDVNMPIDKNQKVMFRINAAMEKKDNWQDAGYKNSTFVAPALTWEINDKMKLDINAEIYKSDFTTPYYLDVSKSDVDDIRDLPIDWSRAFNVGDGLYFNADQTNFNAKLHTKFNSNWYSDTKVAINDNPMDGYINSLYAIPNNLIYHESEFGDQRQMAEDIQQNFHYHKKFGGRWENKLLVGLDYYHFHSWNNATKVNLDTINFKTPAPLYKEGFNRAEVDARLPQGKKSYKKSETFNYSAYFSDVISLDERWFFMASLRVDYFDNRGNLDYLKNQVKDKYNQLAFSPKFGLVYQPIKEKVSLFANYMNSFENENGVDRHGKTFRPEQANQWEGGMKISLMNKSLVSTLSYYHILVDNMLRPDLVDNSFSVQDGTQLSDGIDFNLSYHPAPEWNIQTAFGYNHSKYTKAEGGLQGLRPYDAGPETTANLWVSYKVAKGVLKGVGIAGGGYYGSAVDAVKKRYDFYVPDYTVLGATLFYDQPHYRIGIKLDNLTNEDYWDYRLRKHEPRSFLINLTMKL